MSVRSGPSRLAPPPAALAARGPPRGAAGAVTFARAPRTPIFRTSSTRAMLRPRGIVRPVSHPKIEPGLTPSSRENCSRVIAGGRAGADVLPERRRRVRGVPPRARAPPGARSCAPRIAARAIRARGQPQLLHLALHRAQRAQALLHFLRSQPAHFALSAAASVFTFT
jgi:hypothetical protein